MIVDSDEPAGDNTVELEKTLEQLQQQQQQSV
jgi:hypothetical protein